MERKEVVTAWERTLFRSLITVSLSDFLGRFLPVLLRDSDRVLRMDDVFQNPGGRGGGGWTVGGLLVELQGRELKTFFATSEDVLGEGSLTDAFGSVCEYVLSMIFFRFLRNVIRGDVTNAGRALRAHVAQQVSSWRLRLDAHDEAAENEPFSPFAGVFVATLSITRSVSVHSLIQHVVDAIGEGLGEEPSSSCSLANGVTMRPVMPHVVSFGSLSVTFSKRDCGVHPGFKLTFSDKEVWHAKVRDSRTASEVVEKGGEESMDFCHIDVSGASRSMLLGTDAQRTGFLFVLELIMMSLLHALRLCSRPLFPYDLEELCGIWIFTPSMDGLITLRDYDTLAKRPEMTRQGVVGLLVNTLFEQILVLNDGNDGNHGWVRGWFPAFFDFSVVLARASQVSIGDLAWACEVACLSGDRGTGDVATFLRLARPQHPLENRALKRAIDALGLSVPDALGQAWNWMVARVASLPDSLEMRFVDVRGRPFFEALNVQPPEGISQVEMPDGFPLAVLKPEGLVRSLKSGKAILFAFLRATDGGATRAARLGFLTQSENQLRLLEFQEAKCDEFIASLPARCVAVEKLVRSVCCGGAGP
jgi:hypothetical protein